MKRRRAGASADQAESPAKKADTKDTENVPPSRDTDFYFDDGDLVLQVENTLFKIHKCTLRDSLAFKGMFVVCGTGSPQPEGSDDEHPLILHGDSVRAFKALLVFLHAMPGSWLGLLENLKKVDSLNDLLQLAAISNKYQFESTEKLISDLLHDYLKQFTKHLQETATVDLLKHALGLAAIKESAVLRDGFSRIFATRILDQTVRPDIVLEFADTHGLRILQGAVYYALLYFVVNAKDSKTLEPQKFDLGIGLDARVQSRLLHGSWSLSLCHHFLTHTSPLSPEQCRSLGMARYIHDSVVPLSHPLETLEDIKAMMASYHSDIGRRNLVIAAFDEVIQNFKDRLMDHFDPPP